MNDLNFFGLNSLLSDYDFTDKSRAQLYYLSYMLNRTSQIFEYENLPETMPKRYFELYLQVNGHSCIAPDDKGDIYCFFGGFGGYPDAYYMPTRYVVANPYLGIDRTFIINEDCVLVKNDTMYLGLLPMFKRYASLMVENDISMRMADINARIVALIEAQDDNTKDSATDYIKQIINGNFGVVASTAFLNGLKVNPYGTTSKSNSLTDLIEFQQYLKASWFNEIGLQANYNMKRESINSDEAQLNDDMLLPLIDDMYECRKEGIEQINNMFGTDIRFKFNSSWEDNRIELFATQYNNFSEYSEIDETIEETDDETIEETDETIEETDDETIEETDDETIEETDETIEETDDETIEETDDEIELNEEIEEIIFDEFIDEVTYESEDENETEV